MSDFDFLPDAYRETISYFANRFFNDEALGSASSDRQTEEFLEVLQKFENRFSHMDPWDAWFHSMVEWSTLWQQDRRKDLHKQLSREEYICMAAMGQHLKNGFAAVSIPWPALAQISGFEIDGKVPLGSARNGIAENTLWVELTGDAPDESPWIRKTIGILINRFPACDAPREWNATIADHYAGVNGTLGMAFLGALYKELAEGSPCEMYEAYVVQRTDCLRIVPLYIGHGAGEPVVDALCLAQEITATQKKLKEATVAWTHALIRVLLMRSCLQSADGSQPGVIDESALLCLEGKTGFFFLQNSAEGKMLNFRKKHRPWQPFPVPQLK